MVKATFLAGAKRQIPFKFINVRGAEVQSKQENCTTQLTKIKLLYCASLILNAECDSKKPKLEGHKISQGAIGVIGDRFDECSISRKYDQ